MENPFTLWNAHKAYMRGILLQLGVREKKQMDEKNGHTERPCERGLLQYTAKRLFIY